MKCIRQDVLFLGHDLEQLLCRVIKLPLHPKPGTPRTLKIAPEGGKPRSAWQDKAKRLEEFLRKRQAETARRIHKPRYVCGSSLAPIDSWPVW